MPQIESASQHAPTHLAIRRAVVHPSLRDVIKDIWIFFSGGGLAHDELAIIAPNGSAKLILLYRNRLIGHIGGREFAVPEHRLYVVGVTDSPSTADFDLSQPFGCVCFEFKPSAAYRLLPMPQHELRNAMVPLDGLTEGRVAAALEEKLFALPRPEQKAALLQEHLAAVSSRVHRDAVYEYCAGRIMATYGGLSLSQLSRETGYSGRWIRTKFVDRLGLNPKTFASLVRFQASFQAVLRTKHDEYPQKYLYDPYYDQAHFIKEFKRFIGYSPARYAALLNDVGEIIYTE